MKNYHEYDFQRMSSHNWEGQSLSNTNNKNISKNSGDIRISLLEERIETLEKKVLYFEEMLTIKDNELSKYRKDNELLNDTSKRIAELEETIYQLNSKNNFPLQTLDIENVIDEKLNLQQIIINSKLNDLTIMMEDLSKYNVNQQKQYSNNQEIFSRFKECLNENSSKIKELYKQLKSVPIKYNDNHSDEEELFFKNIRRK